MDLDHGGTFKGYSCFIPAPFRPGIDQNTVKKRGWNKTWISFECSAMVYLQFFQFFLWLALFVIFQALSGEILVCGNRIYDYFNTNSLLLHSNSPKDFIFWSWPCSPRIRDAVNELNFFSPIHASNNIIFILCDIFNSVPGGKVAIQILVKRNEVFIPIIIWRKLGKCCFQLLDDIFWNWRWTNWRLKWRYLIPVFPFHTELKRPSPLLLLLLSFLYLFVGSFNDPERGGEISFRKLNAIKIRNFIMSSWCSCWISGKGF